MTKTLTTLAVLALSLGAVAGTASAATHPTQDMVKQTAACMTHAGASVIRWPNGGKARWGKRWVSWQRSWSRTAGSLPL